LYNVCDDPTPEAVEVYLSISHLDKQYVNS